MHRRFWQKWIFPFSATNLRDQHPVSRALPRFPFLEKGLSGLVAKYRLDESRAVCKRYSAWEGQQAIANAVKGEGKKKERKEANKKE